MQFLDRVENAEIKRLEKEGKLDASENYKTTLSERKFRVRSDIVELGKSIIERIGNEDV